MKDPFQSSIVDYFEQIDDPRVLGRCSHKLIDIVVIVICGIMCNQHDFEAIADFAEEKKDWFQSFLDLPNGIPSHDTLARALSLIDGEQFEKVFNQWVQENRVLIKNQVISFDGKTINGTGKNWGVKHKNKMPRPLAVLNIWASKNELVVGQYKTKSTGSPELGTILKALDYIAMEGMIAAVDAASSKVKFADKVIEKKGDYLMPIKLNQKSISLELQNIFKKRNLEKKRGKSKSPKKGRLEERSCEVIDLDKCHEVLDENVQLKRFRGVRQIIHLNYKRKEIRKSNTRGEVHSDGRVTMVHDGSLSKYKTSRYERYFLTSLKEKDPEKLMGLIREHWNIENALHWRLDTLFDEDGCRVRNKRLASNLSILRKVTLNLLTPFKTKKLNVSKVRTKCTFNDEFRFNVLFGLV